MKRNTYLNVILTVNAVLLAGLLWVQVADTPMLATSVDAQVRNTTPPVMVPNAARQRQDIIDQVKKLNQTLEAIKRQTESGIQVQVTNVEEFGGGS